MKQGSASALGDMSYSYGYVARLSGTETATKGERTMQNETIDMKEIQDGELTLIETRSKGWDKERRSRLINKEHIEGVVGRFTKKKFFLIGADGNKEVKFQGLVSIVEGKPNGTKECLKDVMEGDLKGKCGDVEKLRKEFEASGLFWPKGGYMSEKLTLNGQIVFGNCSKEFFKKGGDIVVVEQLKRGRDGKELGFQELNIKGGMNIAVTVGIKYRKGGRGNYKTIVAPGALVKRDFSGGTNLWVGLQGDGKVSKSNGKEQDRGQGVVMLHGWESKKAKYTDEELMRSQKSTSDGFVKKISLNDEWKYYLWDPSYTKIEKGKLRTRNGKDLPFNIQIGKFVTTKLLK